MKNVLLIDIGAGPLPVVTPVPARQSAWFPVLHTAPPLPTPPNVRTTAVADGILVEWGAVPIDGVIYAVWRSPAEAGPYVIVHRTTGLRYLHTDNTGEPSWFRVSIELNGRESVPSVPVVETPVDVTDAIAGADQAAADALAAALAADAKAAQEIIDRQAAVAQALIDAATDATNKVASEAQARADALLGERLAWEAADLQESTIRQNADESLSQSISLVSAGSGQQFDAKQIWRFDTTVEGWSGTAAPTIVDGWLRPANGTNVYVQSPDNLGVDGSAYRYMKLRIKKVGAPVWKGQVQWTTTTDNTFNAAKSMTIPEPSFDANGIATIDFNDIAWWPATVRRVRITLGDTQAAANYYLIDWVAIGRPTPGAGVALVQEVQEALVTKDSAQSLARETLAAQIRGTYTGTDVAQVTQGLVWSERQARVTAVSTEAGRIDGINGILSNPTTGLGAKASIVYVDEIKLRVNAAEGDIASHTAQITAANNAIDGKASQASVTAIENKINSSATGLDTKASQSALTALTQTVGGKADQSALVTISNKVNSSSSGLDTKASQTALTALTQTVDGKASTGALSSLAGDVSLIDGKVAANSTAVTQVTARTGVLERPNPNLLPNPSGAAGSAGWSVFSGSQTTIGTRDVGTGPQLTYNAAAGAFRLRTEAFPASAGRAYTVSADFWRPSGVAAGFRIRLYYYDAGGGFLTAGPIASVAANGQWQRPVATGETPAGTASIRVDIQRDADGTAEFFVWNRVKVEEGSVVTPFSDDATTGQSASITQSLTAGVGPGGAWAQATMTLDVNGRITGAKLTATGTETSLDILSDYFNVITPSGNGMNLDKSGMWLRLPGNNSFIVSTALGESMDVYYGPTPANLGAAKKASAAFWLSNGTGYFAGQVLQGVLRAFNSSTIATGAVIVTTGSISSNGKAVAVEGKIDHYARQQYNGLSSQITLTGGATRAQVVLERRYGTGAWTTLADRTIAGTASVLNLTDGPSDITWTISGSLMATDVADSRAREYRTRVVSVSRQSFTVTNPGTTPAIVQTQYQSIESME